MQAVLEFENVEVHNSRPISVHGNLDRESPASTLSVALVLNFQNGSIYDIDWLVFDFTCHSRAVDVLAMPRRWAATGVE